MILLNKERIGAQELAEMFEVSPRTIYRDIDAINMADIPIRGAAGVSGGFETFRYLDGAFQSFQHDAGGEAGEYICQGQEFYPR